MDCERDMLCRARIGVSIAPSFRQPSERDEKLLGVRCGVNFSSQFDDYTSQIREIETAVLFTSRLLIAIIRSECAREQQTDEKKKLRLEREANNAENAPTREYQKNISSDGREQQPVDPTRYTISAYIWVYIARATQLKNRKLAFDGISARRRRHFISVDFTCSLAVALFATRISLAKIFSS